MNTNDNMQMILGDFYDDFDFVEVNSNEVSDFLTEIRKTTENNVLAESYVH